jgi:hypothetical protein
LKKEEENSLSSSNEVINRKFEPSLHKNINIKILFKEEKIKNILMKNKIEKKIIDKFDGKFITDKDLESVSLFEIKGKKKKKEIKMMVIILKNK